MGDPVPVPSPTGDAKQVAAFLDMLPPEKQDELFDAIDESNAGHRRMLMRYGIGAAAGLAVGFIAAKLLG